MRRLGSMVLMVGVIMATAVPGALAAGGGKPLFHTRIDERLVQEPDEGVYSLCGVKVNTDFHVWGHFKGFADLSYHSLVHTETVTTDPDSGEVLLVERTVQNVYIPPDSLIVDEAAGTATFTIESTWRGMPFKWQIPGQGVILLNAGTYTFHATVVSDLDTGYVISQEVYYSDVHGPHPSLTQSESDWLEMFCGAMGA